MNSSEGTADAGNPGLTDSPWFWVLAFSLFGLLLLELTAHKFRHRQVQLERQFQARQYAQIEQTAGEKTAQRDVQYSTPERTMVNLVPIRVLALFGVLTAGAMLARQYRHRLASALSGAARQRHL